MRPPLEVADIFRQHGSSFRLTHPLSPEQRRVMRAIEQCRTAALGGHVDQCDTCSLPTRLLQLVSQSPLSQVSVTSQSPLARGAPGRPLAGGVLPCRVYAAGATGCAGIAE